MHRCSAAFLLLSLLVAGAEPSLSSPAEPARPNVLFLCVDDMNDWVGYLSKDGRGYPGKLHTPHLDRLAARGTAFTNAHTAAPVCCPSRVAALSGLLPTSTGIYTNQHWWKPNRPGLVTIPSHFRKNGYHTIGSGKIYHHTAGNNPPGQWDDFQRLVFNDNAWIRHGSPLYPWSKPMKTPAGFPYAGIANYSGEADWGVPPIKEPEYDDFVTATYAVDYLGSLETSGHGRPFFLACGLFHPHMPWYVPQKYLDLYPLDQVVVPEEKPDDLDDIPAPGRKLALRKSDNLKKIREAGLWPTAIRHYLASISFADAQLGRVLDALDASPAARNTIIVLWSDHGWHLGEKGHWHKRTLWEEATRIPLLIVAPGHGGTEQRCDEPASLVDLFPTLNELCGLPPVAKLDGMSLVPWLEDPTRPRSKPAIIVEETGHLAVRSKRHRYIRYKDGSEELYDHQHDPHEWTNLAGRPDSRAIIKEHRKWLPKSPAKPVPGKKAFTFDPDAFTFTHRKTGKVTKGQ